MFPLPDGHTELPRGKLAALVTYLARDLVGLPDAPALPEGYAFARLDAADLAGYRGLFRRIGADWLWFSRLALDDQALAAAIGHEDVTLLGLKRGDATIGLLELDCGDRPVAHLSYLGIIAGETGAGLGRALMAEGLRLALADGAGEIHVNTCSFDHPKALEFYVKCGFRPVRRAIEVFDDPRLTGLLPQDAARHIPLIG